MKWLTGWLVLLINLIKVSGYECIGVSGCLILLAVLSNLRLGMEWGADSGTDKGLEFCFLSPNRASQKQSDKAL